MNQLRDCSAMFGLSMFSSIENKMINYTIITNLLVMYKLLLFIYSIFGNTCIVSRLIFLTLTPNFDSASSSSLKIATMAEQVRTYL